MIRQRIIKGLLGCAGLTGLIYFSGGFFGLALLAGLVVFLFILQWPLLGLGLLIFASTSFQTLVSTGAVGLPISLTKILGPLLLASWILWAVRRRTALTFAPAMIPLLIFAMVVIAWVFLLPDVGESLEGILVFLFPLMLIYLFSANLVIEQRSLIFAFFLLSVAVTIGACIGIVEYLWPQFAIHSLDPSLSTSILGVNIDVDTVQGEVVRRVTGGMGDPTWLAYSLAMTMPLNAFWWRTFSTLSARIVTLTMLLLQMVGLTLSYTRTGFIAVGVAGMYLLLKRRLPLGPVVTLAFASLLIAPVVLPSAFWERMFSLTYLREGSTPIRYDLIRTGWYMMCERPLFGYGYGQFGPHFLKRIVSDPIYRARQEPWLEGLEKAIDKGVEKADKIGPHNLYIEVGVEYGLPGLLSFLAFLFFLVKDLQVVERYGNHWEQDLAICLIASVIAYCTCGLFGHNKMLKTFWIVAGLSAALRRVTFSEPTPTVAPASSGQL